MYTLDRLYTIASNIYLVVDMLLRGMDTLSEETILFKLFSLLSKKGSTLKGHTLLPFFPFRVDPFSEGDKCTGRKRGSHVKFVSLVKWQKTTKSIHFP